MSTPAPEAFTARQPRLRYSLSGMLFVFVLGVSVGLAYWRWENVAFPSAMLASFCTWLLIGVAAQVRRELESLRSAAGASAEVRWGKRLQIATLVGSLLLLSLVAALEVYRRFGLNSMSPIAVERSALPLLSDFLFFLAIIGIYWDAPLIAVSQSLAWRIARPIIDIVLLVVAAKWAALVIGDMSAILVLVHIAIRGVENAQPTRWAGREFYPFRLPGDTASQICDHLLLAFIVLGAAAAAGAVAIHFWRARIMRRALLLVAAACLIGAAALVQWSWSVGLVNLSPFFAEAVGEEVLRLLWLWIILIAVLAAAMAMSFTVVSQREPLGPEGPRPFAPLLHETAGVIVLFVVAVVCEAAIDVWQFLNANYQPQFDWLSWPTLPWGAFRTSCWEFAIQSPQNMIHLAAAIVMVRHIWLRAREKGRGERQWIVEPGRLLAAWLLSMATLSIVVPLVGIYGFADTLRWLMEKYVN